MRPQPGADQPVDRARVARPLEVVGHRVGVGVRRRGQRLAGPAVPARAGAAAERPLVERLADERVGEAHARAVRRLRQQPRRRSPARRGRAGRPRPRSPTAAQSASGTSWPMTAATASSRRVSGASRATPPGDDLPQQRRHGRAGQVAERPAVARPAQRALALERAQQLAQEERVALGAPGQVARPAGRGRPSASGVARRDERADGRRVQRAQVEPRGAGLAHQERQQGGERVVAGDLVGAVGGEEEQGQRRRAAAPATRSRSREAGSAQCRSSSRRTSGLARGERGEVVAHARATMAAWLAERLARRARAAGRPPAGRAGASPRGAGEGLAPGAVGRRLGQVVAAPDQHQRALRGRLGQQRLGEGGLADARLAADEHQRPAPGQRRGERVAQRGQLALAADEAGQWLRQVGRRRPDRPGRRRGAGPPPATGCGRAAQPQRAGQSCDRVGKGARRSPPSSAAIARSLRPARSASAACDNPAASRYCRKSGPNVDEGSAVMETLARWLPAQLDGRKHQRRRV